MSQGKYSPTRAGFDYVNAVFDRNAKGEIPPSTWDVYCEEIHFANYDAFGFDSYGYSAYDGSGLFVGAGNGVDANGYFESDYLSMSQDEYWDCY